MKTEYRALLYSHQAHLLTRPTDTDYILSKINAVLDGDHIGERVLGAFASEADAIACAKKPNVSPILKDAYPKGKLLCWESTEVIKITIDDDGEEDWPDDALVIQYPLPEELVAFVLDELVGDEEDEEDE